MSTPTIASDPAANNHATAPLDESPSAETPDVLTKPASTTADFWSRICEAMDDAGEVTKAKKNTEQNYKFASAEDILAAVRRPLFARRILLTQKPSVYDEKEIKSKHGTAGTLLTVSIDFTFRCGMTGETLLIEDWRGQGQDYGDKAYGKAYTNAAKTFIRAQWLLPTGDDPEASSPGDRMHSSTHNAPAPPEPARVDEQTDKTVRDALVHVIGADRQRDSDILKGLYGYLAGGGDQRVTVDTANVILSLERGVAKILDRAGSEPNTATVPAAPPEGTPGVDGQDSDYPPPLREDDELADPAAIAARDAERAAIAARHQTATQPQLANAADEALNAATAPGTAPTNAITGDLS